MSASLGGGGGKDFSPKVQETSTPPCWEGVPVLQRSSVGFRLGEQVKIQPRGKQKRFFSPSTPK